MRGHAVVAAVVALALLSAAFAVAPAPARAADVPPPKYYITLLATNASGELPRFIGPDAANPNIIVIQTVPAILNITVETGGMAPHTFTIRAADGQTPLINLYLNTTGDVASTEFNMTAADKISINGGNATTVETSGGRLRFVCIPHVPAGMDGFIVVGGVQPEAAQPQMGVFLRAYWIGLLGMAGTLLLIGLSYFVIKSSSPHFRDHHEHVRRGGP